MFQYGVIGSLILLVPWLGMTGMPERETALHLKWEAFHNPGGCEKEVVGEHPHFVQGEVLVKFKAGTTKEAIDGIQRAYGLSLITRIEGIGVYRFKIPPTSTVKDMVDALNDDPRVEYAEPNYRVRIMGK
jgi:thermitase